MKKRIIVLSVTLLILIVSISALYIPYFRSALLCADIEAGRTQDAIKKIDTVKNVNCPTCPMFMRKVLNYVETDIDLPLVVACKNGDYQVVEALLQKGADPNKFYKGSFTATEAVFAENHSNELEILELLVKNKADVTKKSGSQKSSLFWACMKLVSERDIERKEEFSKCIEILMEYDKTWTDENSNTVLHYAVLAEYTPLIEQFVNNENWLINSVNNDGQTALFKAVETNYLTIIEFLLENGADKSIKDSSGKTAYDYAVEKGYTEIALLLK